MPTFSYQTQILDTLPPAVRPLIENMLFKQAGVLYAAQVEDLLTVWGIGRDTLVERLLPFAAACAVAPISSFYVGVIIEGESGNFYMGANMEFVGGFLGLSIHGEQAAINNAWLHGEKAIRGLTVNAAPCGHCRQFLHELNSSDTMQVTVISPAGKHSAALSHYLPEAFGPTDLGIKTSILSSARSTITLDKRADLNDPLVALAAQAAAQSYAPYSNGHAGLALETRDGIRVVGCYAESAAYNPSLQPLASALSQLRFQCLGKDVDIQRIVIVEKSTHVDHMSHIAAMRNWLSDNRMLEVEHFFCH